MLAMTKQSLFQKATRGADKGTILFRDGDLGATMYVLQSGRVRIFTEAAGETKTLAFLEAGDFFGEMAILNNKPRTASAEVVENATMLEIDGEMLEQMVRGNSEISLRLIKKLAHRLDNANALIDMMIQQDPKSRVILGLSREAEFHGEIQEDGSVLVPLDHAQLAEQVGLPPGEIENVLKRMQRLGLIESTDDGFRVKDRLRMHEFLDFLRNRS